ncbi:FAD-dependent oxidoreductase [Salibacterium aidingense]|uniref:FAD-dependent oxidoreductase n=1 Tax=Salibacterium aidingense TaxID=384933 RepID=UPI003BE048D6
MTQRLIVIGTGMSSLRLMETIVAEAPGQFSIQAFGEEPFLPYNRVKLSSWLQAEHREAALYPHHSDWYADNDIHVHTNERIIQIDPPAKTVLTENGERYGYDYAVIAAGSSPVRLNIPGSGKKGVQTFRTLEDARRLKDIAFRRQKAVVVGGGFLGLEAAYGLAKAGTKVEVIQRADTLLPPQLDETASQYLQKELEKHGITFHFGQSIQEVTGGQEVQGAVLQDGTFLPADTVLFAAGILPNSQLAEESGLAVNRGILVDDYMKTSTDSVYAIGECAEHNGTTYGLVPPVYEHAHTAALHLSGKPSSPYNGSSSYSHLKIAGVDLFTGGRMEESEDTHVIVQADSTRPLYQKVVLRHDVIQGAVLFGDTSTADDITERLQNQKPLSMTEKIQLFSGEGKTEKLVHCTPETTICKCNQVNKRTILRHIAATEKASAATIQEDTRASTSCGGCAADVSSLLQVFDRCKDQASVNTFCSCTMWEEEQVKEKVFSGEWKRMEDVFRSAAWQNEGCDICIPALTYYFSLTGKIAWQKAPWVLEEADGRYTVTSLPIRGDDSGDILRQWMKLQENLPGSRLRFESDQRLSLSGITEEQMNEVCTAAGLPQHVFAGANLKPFTIETRRNRELFYRLERNLYTLSFPSTFTIRTTSVFPDGLSKYELGLVWNEDAWEMHAEGDTGRIILYAAQEQEVEDMVKTTIQHFRETAFFEEPFADWILRLSPVTIREILFLEDDRELLIQALEEHIEIAQGNAVIHSI